MTDPVRSPRNERTASSFARNGRCAAINDHGESPTLTARRTAERWWCRGTETRYAPWAKPTGRIACRCRRRPTLPRPLGRSTIGAVELNDRVRDGNGCGPYALAT